MEGLKFCSATVFQFLLIGLLFFAIGKIKSQARRAIRDALGVPSQTRQSTVTIVIFVLFMSSFIWMMNQVSSLVLNSKTLGILVATVGSILFLSGLLSKRIRSELQPFLLPHERTREISILLVLAGGLLSVSFVIEASFRFHVASSPIEGQVQTVKPTRVGSPIFSLKVHIPEHEFNHEKSGISFLRFDSRDTSDRFASGQSLQLILQKGSLGLNRVLPLPAQSYLKTRVLF